MNTITLPYGRLMLNYGRVQGNIKSVRAMVKPNGIELLNFDIDNSTRNSFNHIKKWLHKSEIDVPYKPKYNVGDEVIYFDSNPYAENVLQKGIIEAIEIATYQTSITNYFYFINGKSYLVYDIYKNKEDYIKRTSPTKELRDGERFLMTKYLTQQNYLIPVKVEPVSKTHYIIKSNNSYGEKIRGTFLYTKVKKFHNRMFSNLTSN